MDFCPVQCERLLIFRVRVKSVSLYHSKFACLALHIAVKEFSKPTSKNGEIGRFNRALIIESFLVTLKFHSLIPSYINNMKTGHTFSCYKHN